MLPFSPFESYSFYVCLHLQKDNGVVKVVGAIPPKKELHHHEVLAMIDGYVPEKGAEIAGHRAYYLKGWGMRLNLALQKYGIDFLLKNGCMFLLDHVWTFDAIVFTFPVSSSST